MGKKKTHAEYVSELAKVNPDIEVLGIYCGANIKIPHRCKKHNVVWDIAPTHALTKGYGCTECKSEKLSKKFSKTHEQYIKQLAEKNANIEVLETYNGANTKILHRCKIDGYEWSPTPAHVLNGTGCPVCAGNIQKTHQEYIMELKEFDSNIEVVGEYCNAMTNILHHCIIHDIYFDSNPSNILQGKTGCYLCANEKRRTAMVISKEEYIEKLHKISPYIDIVGDYINMRTKTHHYCNKHKVEFETTPDNALRGRGCSECGKEKYHASRARTTNEYISLVKDINPDIEVLGEYISNGTPILHRCRKHNIEWNAIPYGILSGWGCKECKYEKIADSKRKTHEQYVKELREVNPDIEVIEKYIDCDTPILHKCKKDGYEWRIRPANLLIGYNCPVCGESRGERKIRQWLEKNNISYIYQHKYEDCKDVNPLPFDFYLPTYNILIEYDGEQHFRPIEYFGGQEKFELQQKHDKIKNEYCEKNNIPLLRIPYFKYDNVEEELNNFLFI